MKNFIKKIIFILFFISTGLFYLNAQGMPLTGSLSLNPKYPSPYQQITVKLISYSFDTNSSEISWYVNNELIQSGYGKDSLSLNVGKEGYQTLVKVKVLTNNQRNYETAIIISPQAVDLVWEAVESYIPPFYKGKALPGEGSMVKITALPNFYSNGKKIPAENISYTWSLNSIVAQNFSGYGKESFTTYLDYLSNTNEIKVVAKTTDGTGAAEKLITIIPTSIDPIFYEYDSTLGPNYAKALGNFMEITKDFFLNIEPFFLSTKGISSSGAYYNWSLNGLPITAIDNTHISLHPKEGTSGVSIISVSLGNTKRILQEIEKKIEISFNK